MVTTKERTAVVREEDIATLDNFADKKLQEATELSEVMAVDPPLVQREGIYLISGLLAVTLSLLYFGKVTVWAKAKGSIIPEGESIPVQALRSVLARVGDRLPKNAPLLTLDTSQSDADLNQLQGQLDLQQKRLQALQQNRTQVETILAAPETFLAQKQTVNFHDSNLLQTIINQRLIEAGRRAQVEIVQSQTQVANREVILLQAENNFESSMLNLIQILDIDKSFRIIPTETIVVEPNALEVEQLMTLAFANRPDYLQA